MGWQNAIVAHGHECVVAMNVWYITEGVPVPVGPRTLEEERAYQADGTLFRGAVISVLEEKARAKDSRARGNEGSSSAHVVQKKNFQYHKNKGKGKAEV